MKHPQHILLCYKNFSHDCHVSHIGLGVTAQYSAKTLSHHGYMAQAKPIFGADDLSVYLEQNQKNPHLPKVTHVLIMAQFIATKHLATMVRRFPEIKFAMKCHSNVGFLQAEPAAITLLREAIDLQIGTTNFHAASNNARLTQALKGMYGTPVTYLPNLYYLHGHEPIHRPLWNGGLLRLGAFGSHRIYKNFSTAVAAAIELTSQLKVHSEIWINAGRSDGAGNAVYKTAIAWTRGLPNVTLRELHWASWPEFRRFAGSMNLLFQPSYTETFNNVTADGIANGVASVVGESIEWVPESWKAEPDDSSAVAGVARRLLLDPHAVKEGYHSLQNYVKHGLREWEHFLA